MFNHVRKTINKITKNPDAYEAEVCGSFRRGKASCGDMDIIITRKDGVFENDLLVKLVAELQKNGFITDNLSEPKNQDGHVSTSYMGVCKFED
jgi:DNA polymerase lambda